MSQRALSSVIVLFCLKIATVNAQVPTLYPTQTVNVATGEMSFSLPLGSIKGVNGPEFPINLNYKAGIRVEQEATPAGLGFDVAAGGIWRKTVMIDDNTSDYTETPQNDCFQKFWKRFLNIFLWINNSIGSFALACIPGLQPVAAIFISVLASLGDMAQNIALNSIVFEPANYSTGGEHDKQYQYSKVPSEYRGKGYFCGGSGYDLPDIYYISTPYINGEIVPVGEPAEGRFVLRNGAGAPDGETAVKITYKKNIEEFEVTLSDGTKLFIGGEYVNTGALLTEIYGYDEADDAICEIRASIKSGSPHALYWHLRKVVLPGDGSRCINFSYQTILQELYKGGGIKYQVNRKYCAKIFVQSTKMCFLQCVSSPIQSAAFEYEADRKDDIWYWYEPTGSTVRRVGPECGLAPLRPRDAPAEEKDEPIYSLLKFTGQLRLKKIKMFNENAIVKEIAFGTNYTLRPNSPGGYYDYRIEDCFGLDPYPRSVAVYPNFMSGYDGSALTLNTITISDGNGKYLPPITFKYDLTDGNPALHLPLCTLPEGADDDGDHTHYREYFNAIEKDMWGYYCSAGYNNATPNQSVNVPNYEGDYTKAASASVWSIKGVDFPNGMKINWEYEPNRYDTVNTVGVGIKYGCGIRVKKMTIDDGIQNKTQTLSYYYTDKMHDFNETTGGCSGFCNAEPQVPILNTDYRVEKVRRGGHYAPAKVSYHTVHVVPNAAGGGVTPEGYTVFKYTNTKEYPNFGEYGEVDNGYKCGMLKYKGVFNATHKEITRVENEYKDFNFCVPETRAVPLTNKNTIGVVRTKKCHETTSGITRTNENFYAGEEIARMNKTSPDLVNVSLSPDFFVVPISPHNHEDDMNYSDFSVANTTVFGNNTLDDVLLIEQRDYTYTEYSGGHAINHYINRVYFDLIKDIEWNGQNTKHSPLLSFVLEYNPCTDYCTCSGSRESIDSKSFRIDGIFTEIISGNLTSDIYYHYTCYYGGPIHNVYLKKRVWTDGNTFSSSAAEVISQSQIRDNRSKTCTVAGNVQLNVQKFPDFEIFQFSRPVVVAKTDLDGIPNYTFSYGAANNSLRLVTHMIPAYQMYPRMKSGNLLAMNCGKIDYSVSGLTSTPEALVLKEVRASATHWADLVFTYLPVANYNWKVEMNNSGIPVTPYVPFNYTTPSARDDAWKFASSFEKFGRFDSPLETKNGNGIYSATEYRNDLLLPIGSITNSKFDECAVFTCDYDMDESGFFDAYIGWKHYNNTIFPSGAICAVESATPTHFGEKCLHVKNCQAAARNVAVHSATAKITWSAWVRPVNESPIRFAACLVENGIGNHNVVYDFQYTKAEGLKADGSWQFVKFTIDLSKPVSGTLPPSFDGKPDAQGKDDGIYVWVGNNTGDPTSEFYIEDIRIYPATSFVTTTYYDSKWQQPILTVDANGNPSQKVEYDEFGRPVRWYKVNKNDPSVKTLLQEKEYHLMGDFFNPNPNKWYKIITDVNENFCIDIDGSTLSDGQNIRLLSYTGISNQLWKFIPAGNGYYNIVSKGGPTFGIDDPSGTITNGAQLKIKTVAGDNQKWKLTDAGEGFCRISAKASVAAFIDLENGNAAVGKLQIWQSGTYNRWKLVLVE